MDTRKNTPWISLAFCRGEIGAKKLIGAEPYLPLYWFGSLLKDQKYKTSMFYLAGCGGCGRIMMSNAERWSVTTIFMKIRGTEFGRCQVFLWIFTSLKPFLVVVLNLITRSE
jgi:hypothetical protein